MDILLTNFIHALRNADIRISTAETLDALNAVELVGYGDRKLLKNSLALALPKTLEEKAVFDTTFDQFFASRGVSSLQTPGSDGVDEPSDAAPTADRGQNQSGGSQDGQNPQSTPSSRQSTSPAKQPGESEMHGSSVADGVRLEPQSALGQLLTRGNQIEIDIAINSAGERVKAYEIEVFTQKGVYTRRIMEAMGLAALQTEIGELAGSEDVAERRLSQDLIRRRDWLQVAVRDYVERQFLLHADVTGKRLREDLLRNVRLGTIDQRHRRIVQDLVRRMARRLVAAYSRRRKVFDRGSLHVPRTLRRNMKYDDAIFDLHWKSVKVDRPRVMAICDVSGSVANYASFMLMFLYSLDEVLPKVRSFAFSSDLAEVSDLFAQYDIDAAMALTLKQYGGGSTDYGQAFADFRRLCLEDIDKRTTIVILGDARSNYGDARTDVLKEIYERCKRLIWLNPERALSGTPATPKCGISQPIVTR
ncbi:MAG TPA: VWA domain-containing protein [Steroidobacteraceae bacterium]